MKISKLVGIISVVFIIGLIGFLISQESSNKPIENIKSVDATKIDVKTEEEQKLEEIKEQAKLNIEVSNLYLVKCSSCHGKIGEGTKVAPSISGKSKEYILTKLDDYKNNRVSNSLMKGLLNNATDLELEELAKEISNFK